MPPTHHPVTTATPGSPALASAAPGRARGSARSAFVLSTRRLTPEMIQVVVHGPDLVDLPVGDVTDAYVKLVFPPAGAPYRTAEEFSAMRESLEPSQRPTLRTYTIRAYDGAAGELTLDFVHHGDEGLAGPWAAAACPGDALILLGPGGGYAPDPAADWHLLVGDESALPAIARSLERIPAGVPAHVFVEVAGPTEEQLLPSAADLHLTWVHRDARGGVRGEALVAAVQAADLPVGQVHAFVHGEAGWVKQLRHHLRFDRGVAKEALSVSGYWRLGRDDEAWRAEKARWKADVDADEQAHAGRPTAGL